MGQGAGGHVVGGGDGAVAGDSACATGQEAGYACGKDGEEDAG